MGTPLEEWQRFIDGPGAEGPLPPVILDSWRRSEAAGVDPRPETIRFRRVDDGELQRRLETNADWLAIARPHLEWLATTFSGGPHVVYLTDRDGIVLEALGSEAMMETFGLSPGYDWSEAQMGTNGAGTALAAAQPVAVLGPQHFVSAFHDCTCTGAPVHAPDGTLIGALDISTPAANAGPERLSIAAHAAYSIGRELAYRHQEHSLKHAEKSLRESNDRFRQLADAMPQFVWVTRPDGYHEYYNQKWYDYIGCTPEECIGHGWNLPLHPDDRQRAIDRWNLALRTGEPYEIEYRFRGRDGGYRWFLGRALPVRDESGRIVRWFGTCTDIEDMKRAEKALRESEARYRSAEQALRASQERLMAALSASDTGTFRWDPETGTFLEFDDSLKRLFGFAPDHPVHSTEDFISRVHPEDKSKLIPAVDRCRRGEDFEMEYRVILPDGSLRWLYDRAKMSCDADRRPTHLVGACIDITKRKRTEEALKEAHRRKDEFLAMLGHELRNPLAAISSGLDVLAMAPGTHRETVALMQGQLEHLVRLVDDLLDVSRIMRGKLELRRETVELAPLIRRAAEAVRPMIDGRQQELILSLPEESIWLNADPVRIVQALGNLLNNASKYTDPRGRIELIAAAEDREATITLRDTGVGIDPDLLPRVFELFTQSSRSLDRAEGGLGIGLTLVKNLIDLHEGTVSAHSDGVGQGSTFVVRLPLAEPATPPETKNDPPPVPESRRILVVEDNLAAARMLSVLLGKLGDHEVAIAADGPEALSRIREFSPQIVLLDIGLPEMDGYQVARAVRETPRGDELLLVALTGYGQDRDRQKSKAAGFDEHFVKPLSLDQINALLAHPKLRPADRPHHAEAPESSAPGTSQVPANVSVGDNGQAGGNRPWESPTLDPSRMRHDLKNTAHVLKLIGQMLSEGNEDPHFARTIRESLEQEASTLNDVVATLQQFTRTTRDRHADSL